VTTFQSSKLLPSLFHKIEDDARISVLHVGTALPETIDFFSDFRCKLYFVDLFDELPITANEDNKPTLEQYFTQSLNFDPNIQFDVCLFWDFFNFLGNEAVSAFMAVLKPHLHANTLGHAFAVHKRKSEQSKQLYGIVDANRIRVRTRSTLLPAYAPQPQARLENMLTCLNFDRSVLLPDGRLELLLSAKL